MDYCKLIMISKKKVILKILSTVIKNIRSATFHLKNYTFRRASISSIIFLDDKYGWSVKFLSLCIFEACEVIQRQTGYDHNRNNFCLHDFHDLCTCKCEEPRGTWMWRPLCRKDESIWISVDTTPSDDNDDEKIMLKIFFTKSWLSAALAPAMTQSWAQTRAISMFIWITWFSIMIILHIFISVSTFDLLGQNCDHLDHLPKQSGDQKLFCMDSIISCFSSQCFLCQSPYPSRVKDSQHPEEDQGDHDKDDQGGRCWGF